MSEKEKTVVLAAGLALLLWWLQKPREIVTATLQFEGLDDDGGFNAE